MTQARQMFCDKIQYSCQMAILFRFVKIHSRPQTTATHYELHVHVSYFFILSVKVARIQSHMLGKMFAM